MNNDVGNNYSDEELLELMRLFPNNLNKFEEIIHFIDKLKLMKINSNHWRKILDKMMELHNITDIDQQWTYILELMDKLPLPGLATITKGSTKSGEIINTKFFK